MSQTDSRKPRIDLTGQKIGKLLVIERDYEAQQNGSKGQVYWKCQCECGNIISKTTYNLTHSKTKIPACRHCLSGFNDLQGKQFDALTVLRDSGQRKQRKILWECQCQCGKIVYRTSSLLQDHSTFHSCGCMDNIKQMIDISNQRFGHLVAISPNFTYKQERGIKTIGTAYWNCLCDCGKTTVVSRNNLINGATISCGHGVLSKGEELIKQILDQNKIIYEQQKTFDTCKSSVGAKLKFDFYINNEFLLEYDGRQHFEVPGGSYFTEEEVKKIKERDIIKNKWCKKNNIILKRIPYTINNITLEDIMGNKYIFEETYEEVME